MSSILWALCKLDFNTSNVTQVICLQQGCHLLLQWNCFNRFESSLTALPTLDVNEGALNTIFDIYKQQLPRMGGYLVQNGQLQHSRLELILLELGKLELEILEQRAKVSLWMRRPHLTSLDHISTIFPALYFYLPFIREGFRASLLLPPRFFLICAVLGLLAWHLAKWPEIWKV